MEPQKINKSLSNGLYFMCLLVICAVQFSCRPANRLSPDEKKLVIDSCRDMMSRIEQDVSAKGPIAWIDYFENSPDFFMASGGKMAFSDYNTAVDFTRNSIAKILPKIELAWEDISVRPLSDDFAAIGSDFHENTTSVKGQKTMYDGYFTATAHFDGQRWRLRNLHWSMNAVHYDYQLLR